jgi:hypothetical protein
MRSGIRLAMAVGLFSASCLSARADVLDTITDAPGSVFRFFRGMVSSDRAQQNPQSGDVEVVSAPGTGAPARPDEVLSPRMKAALSKRDAYGAPQTPTICTNCQ